MNRAPAVVKSFNPGVLGTFSSVAKLASFQGAKFNACEKSGVLLLKSVISLVYWLVIDGYILRQI